MSKEEIKQLIIKTAIVSATIAVVVLVGYWILNLINFIKSLYFIFDILKPFIIGCGIAYILAPLCNKVDGFIQKHSKMKEKQSNILSVTFTEIVALEFMILCILIIIPQLAASIRNIVVAMPDAIDKLQDMISNNKNLSNLVSSALNKDLSKDVINLKEELTNITSKYLAPNADKIIGSVTTGVTSATGVAIDVLMGLVLNIFILANRKTLVRQLKKLLNAVFGKTVTRYITEEAVTANKIFGGFFTGKIIDSLIVCVICFVGLSILRIPYALLISIIVGITNIIPIVGPFIGAIPGFIIVLSESPIKSLWFLIFILVLQQIDGKIIGPKCIGNVTGLSTLWILVALTLFGSLWGIVGMLVGVPLMAVIKDIVTRLTNFLLAKRGIKQEDI